MRTDKVPNANVVATETPTSDPAVVKTVDLNRYSGLWYEIAHAPTFFQKNCTRSTAEYKVLSADSVSVYNICYKNNKKHSDIKGVAKVIDASVPAKLKVDFNIFATGDYWIVALDENYQWAVVSGPDKDSLFILARKGPMASALLDKILSDLQARNFKTDNLVYDQY